ncbi:MAG: acetophenone carboxylase [Deltaproteobacteria bacterium]|nr:acetophenone carboxylase [Deltaproteobacteria bacterium]
MKAQITEGLHINLETEMWVCAKCGSDLVSCHKNYKEGCLVSERLPSDVHRPLVEGEVTFSPDPRWCRILEYYCPECGLLIEVEYLPPGHPPIHDIQLDIESLKNR